MSIESLQATDCAAPTSEKEPKPRHKHKITYIKLYTLCDNGHLVQIKKVIYSPSQQKRQAQCLLGFPSDNFK